MFAAAVSLFLLLRWPMAMAAPRWPDAVSMAEFRGNLSGKIHLRGSAEFLKRSQMKNTRFSTRPAFIVEALSDRDVALTLRLARRFQLRSTVASSGHDFIGRQIAPNSLHIDLSAMKRIKVNLTDSESSTSMSAVIDTGTSWKDVYVELNKVNKVIVGGSAHTVALGGYIQGGGHSPICRKYGAAVDHVISMTFVSLDGRVFQVTKEGYRDETGRMITDPSLFWALRGGGGGTFGIVTTYKLAIHNPPPAFTKAILVWPMKGENDEPIGRDIMKGVDNWVSEHRDDNNIGGYIVTGNTWDKKYARGKILLSILYAAEYEKAITVLNKLMTIQPDQRFFAEVYNYSTFWAYEKDVIDTTGIPVATINRLVDADTLSSGNYSDMLWDGYFGVGSQPKLGCTAILVGGKMRNWMDNSSSVTDRFRDSIYATTCITSWENPTHQDYRIKVVLGTFARKFYTKGEGVYFNEPDENLKNWKTEYWASDGQYEALLNVKKKWDPENRFWCHHCVGSDLVPRPNNQEPGGSYFVSSSIMVVPHFGWLLITLLSVVLTVSSQ